MAENQSPQNSLKKKRSHYRLVLMDEDSFEEVVSFNLNRLSVYIGMSTLFVVMIGITSALIIFTPLKYYLPGVGYGNSKTFKEFRQLKLKTDSMDKAMQLNNKYVEDLKKVLSGKASALDTSILILPSEESGE